MNNQLELSAEQERRLEEGAERHDAKIVREVLLQAVDTTVESILSPRPALNSQHPAAPTARRALLEELAAELADIPALPPEALSRAGIYIEYP